MSLCIVIISMGGTGKSNFSNELIQRLVSKTEQPMELPVEVETAELAEQEAEMNLCKMLEETLQKLRIQEEIVRRQRKLRQELSERCRKLFIAQKANVNATIKARIEEFEALLHRTIVDFQKCIDKKMDEFIRITLRKKMHDYIVSPFSVHEPSLKREVINNGRKSLKSLGCRRSAEGIPLWRLTLRLEHEAPIRGYIRLQRPYLINCNMCGSVA